MNRLPGLLFAACAVYLVWWVTHNPFPDGFQNEYLHVGNAYDLWGALAKGDLWHLRYYAYTGYWPWGFLAIPWPALAVLGPGRLALVSGNLVHLSVMLWAAHRLGRSLHAPLSGAMLVLSPAVFGTLVRFEPNLANIAWTLAGLACLVESQGLRHRPWVLGWGLCLGLGLMFDRLTVGFFLIPATIPLILRLDRRGVHNLCLALLLAFSLTFAYYREFFLRHTEELLAQAPVGEIDAKGDLTEPTGSFRVFYYLLVLLDSQLGLGIGGLTLVGLGVTLRRLGPLGMRAVGRPEAVLLAASLPAILFFSLLDKKQVYYTLPAIGPLIVLAGSLGRWAWLGLGAGTLALGALGIGLLPGAFSGTGFMPAAWTAPHHVLARPPSGEAWPLDLIAHATAESSNILVFSADPLAYEGFLVLGLRERRPDAQVRGVVLDPVGTYENLQDQTALLVVGGPELGWPDATTVAAEMLEDYGSLDRYPPVHQRLATAMPDFQLAQYWTVAPTGGTPIQFALWTRVAPAEDRPPE